MWKSSSCRTVVLLILCVLVMALFATAEDGTADSTLDTHTCSADFAVQLHKAIVRPGPEDNAIFSPFSITAVLAMLLEGAREKTALQLVRALHWEHSYVQVRYFFYEYLEMLRRESTNYTLITANRMYANERFSILDDFVSTSIHYYGSNIVSADFEGNSEKERNAINQWVREETKGKIQDLLPTGSVSSLTALIIANAVYFKGSWANPFSPELTQPGTFTTDKGEKFTVNLMRMKKKLMAGYHDDLKSYVVELPYVGGELSMFLVVPDKTKEQTLASLEEALTEDTLLQMTRQVSLTLVDLAVPKFRVQSSVDAKAVLYGLGVEDLFLSSVADLSGIDGKKDLHVSSIVHKAFLEISEEGTEAAAATGATIQKRSIEFPLDVHADHPFLFFVWDKRVNVALFFGRFAKPDEFSVTRDATTPRVEL